MTDYRPPKLAEKILTKLQYDDVWKTTLGDFEEYHAHLVEKNGLRAANWWYWKQVLRYTPSKIVHKLYWTIEMFFSYLKMSFRRLRTNKSYSFINISGLAIGLASFLLIGLFVLHELSYDKHFEDSDRTYRIVMQEKEKHQGKNWLAVTPMPLHSSLKEVFPHFEHTTYVRPYSILLKADANSFFENGLYVGGDFFETFDYTWLQGNPATALNDPSAIILTRSLSEKLFGNKNPIGKTLEVVPEYKSEANVKLITGVIDDLDKPSHLQFSFIANEKTSVWHQGNFNQWSGNNYVTYAKVGENYTLSNNLLGQINEYYNNQMLTSGYHPENISKLVFQPIASVHLKSAHINHPLPIVLGNIKYVYALFLIGLIILLIACVNYMNLATARAVMRSKEVGVRKVIGALRSNLILQFTSEAVLLSLFSITFAVALVWVCLEPFSGLVNRSLEADFFISIGFWSTVLAISFLAGIIAGSYPAFYMSSLKPASIFKNHTRGGKRNSFMRSTLVMGQFAITTVLIICSLVIFKQLDFIRSTDAGYSRDQILTVKLTDENFAKSYDAISQSLKTNPNILSVSVGNDLPMNVQSSTSSVNWIGREESVKFYLHNMHYDYLEMMEIDLVAGRFLSKAFSTDETNAFIINEFAAASMGFTPEEVLGTELRVGNKVGDVVGVVEDYNFLSLRLDQAALLIGFINRAQDYNHLVMKVRPDNLPETIAFVKTEVKKASPDFPFEYAFLDDAFDNMYKTDLNLGTLLSAFTLLALFIAAIGLFGLASFMMEQRVKEIGIRKVLGANLVQILTVVNKDFIKIIALSFVIAAPIGWYSMNKWLEGFAYKIELGPSVFIASATIAIGIALLTVSYKSIKTALANPVDSLKSE